LGGATIASDLVHLKILNMDPTRLSSAGLTGLYFGMIQGLRGDNSSFMRNVAVGGVTDVVANSYNVINGRWTF